LIQLILFQGSPAVWSEFEEEFTGFSLKLAQLMVKSRAFPLDFPLRPVFRRRKVLFLLETSAVRSPRGCKNWKIKFRTYKKACLKNSQKFAVVHFSR